jgi:transposase-like protein
MAITATNPFKGRQYPSEVISLAVHWYLRYPLAYLHLSEILAERGLFIDASCIWRWVQAYAPELDRRCRPHLKPTKKSYRVDETYVKVKGQDRYLYRAVDSSGQTIDFLLTAKRDAAGAKRFFRKAFQATGNPSPRVVNVDKNPAYPAAVEALKAERHPAKPRSPPSVQIPEQHPRAGPQNREEACLAGERIRFISECLADSVGNRNDAHDQQGTSQMAGQGRRGRSGSLRRQPLRHH